MDGFECLILDKNDRLLYSRNDAIEFKENEGEYSVTAIFPIDDNKRLQNGMQLAFTNIDDDMVIYEIMDNSVDALEKTIEVTASHRAPVELHDNVIIDRRPTNTTAGHAASIALNGTGWALRNVVDTEQRSCRYWYCSSWEALQVIAEKWGCDFSFAWEIDDNGIVAKYVDVVSSTGVDRGKRYDVSRDVTGLKVFTDDSDVVTALYGRGKGEEIETDTGGVAYGRKISFKDIVWSVANGDPVDKPAGQEWVEDVEATAVYGRYGRRRERVIVFDDCTDSNELLQLTYNALQSMSRPKVTITANVVSLERLWGRAFEGVRRKDYVTVISDEIGLETKISVTNIIRDHIHKEQTELVLGNEILSITDIQARTSASLEQAKADAQLGAQIAEKNPDLIRGVIDTMVTQITSSGTKMYTDPNDGSLIFENTDGTSAVKICGEGILISGNRVDAQWVWSTALNGTGIVASMITSGVLQASLIKILGTTQFYWDAANIVIQNPDNLNQQIRIGLYDGKNYGIAYTIDGGETWLSAISFNGITLGAGSIGKESLTDDLLQILEGNGIIQSDTAPENPNQDDLWLDTSKSPAILKMLNDEGEWVECSISRNEIDNMLKRLSDHDARFTVMDESISAKVSQTDYVKDMAGKANTADVLERFESEAKLTAENLQIKFSESKDYTDNAVAGFNELVENVQTYFTFGTDGLEIGKTGSSFTTKITNEKLSFLQDGNEVAFIAHNRMYITEARVTDRLSIGTEDNGYFDWVTTSDGLGLKWR